MFGFGKGSDTSKPGPRQLPPKEILREACNRNTPLCVIRPEKAGRIPMARGRMLELRDGEIDIDRVSVPGLEVEFHRGDALQAYFSIGKTLYHFRTRLEKLSVPKRLNARMVIPAMTLQAPSSIEEGDRRNIFRVSVAARADRPLVQAWRLVDMPEEETSSDEQDPAESASLPSMAFNMHDVDLETALAQNLRDPDYEGWVVDATEEGLGVRIEAGRPGRFGIFEPLLVRVTMPAEAECVGEDGRDLHELDFITEVRAKRPVGDDGSRLGLVMIEEADMNIMRLKKRILRDYLSQVQREQLRKNKGVA